MTDLDRQLRELPAAEAAVAAVRTDLRLDPDFLRDEQLTHAVAHGRRTGTFPHTVGRAAAWALSRLAGTLETPLEQPRIPVRSSVGDERHAPDCSFACRLPAQTLDLATVTAPSTQPRPCRFCRGSAWVYDPDLLPLLTLVETASRQVAHPLPDLDPVQVRAAFTAAARVADTHLGEPTRHP